MMCLEQQQSLTFWVWLSAAARYGNLGRGVCCLLFAAAARFMLVERQLCRLAIQLEHCLSIRISSVV